MKAEEHEKICDLAGQQVRLPLFALEAWLFPHIPLQLQVFERRYLDMVTEQLKNDQGFGVVAIRQGREVGAVPEIFPLGVAVGVVDWGQRSNGVLSITVQGKHKFRVLRREVQPNQLLVGDIEYLPDEDARPIDEHYLGLLRLLNQLKQHAAIKAMALPPVSDTAELSWQLAQVLPLGPVEKMALLALERPEERLDCIARKIGQFSASEPTATE